MLHGTCVTGLDAGCSCWVACFQRHQWVLSLGLPPDTQSLQVLQPLALGTWLCHCQGRSSRLPTVRQQCGCALQVTGSCSTPVAMLLTPPSARALLQALSHCLAFDASTAAMLLAASAPQSDVLQLSPALPKLHAASLDDGPMSHENYDQRQPGSKEAAELHGNVGEAASSGTETSLDDGAAASQSDDHDRSSSVRLLPARIPLALQLISKPESYEALCGVARMLGHVAAQQGAPRRLWCISAHMLAVCCRAGGRRHEILSLTLLWKEFACTCESA